MSNKYYDDIVSSYNDKSDTTISRYHKLRRITDSDDDTYIESYEQINIPNRDDDQYYIVTAAEEDRIDLVSYKFYSNPLYWWVIAEASDISDPEILPIGTLLRIPSLQSILGYKGVLQ